VGAGEHTDEIDRDQPLPQLRIGLGEEPELIGAGVVDEDRERPALGDQPRRGGRVGDVQWGGLGADLRRDRPRAVDVEITDHHVGALGRKPRRDRCADPARAACDKRASALEPHRGASICARPIRASGRRGIDCRDP
jgi:hypothetical protein